MIPGMNPALIGHLIKGYFTGILNGTAPEGLKIVSDDPETTVSARKITLAPLEVPKIEGGQVNSLYASVTYEGVNVVLILE
jgi:hypothetical protein